MGEGVGDDQYHDPEGHGRPQEDVAPLLTQEIPQAYDEKVLLAPAFFIIDERAAFMSPPYSLAMAASGVMLLATFMG
jgi:hypothetical protein